jgi:hypothetical protein
LFAGLHEDHEGGQDGESEADAGHLRSSGVPAKNKHYTDKQHDCGDSGAEADEPQLF